MGFQCQGLLNIRVEGATIRLKSDWQDRLELEDLRALTPLIYAHVNPYGRFYLEMDERLSLDE